MAQDNIQFTHELIKGKIAEIIFEQMIHNTKGYTILEFGYEKVVRQLAKERKNRAAQDTIEIVRRAPDFVIINEESHTITLVEVKFMRNRTQRSVLTAAKNIKRSWKKASLFVASPDGFFFGTVDEIIEAEGAIPSFTHAMIPAKTQTQYHDLLNEFIASGE